VSLPRDIRSTPFLRIDENEYVDVFVAPDSETVTRSASQRPLASGELHLTYCKCACVCGVQEVVVHAPPAQGAEAQGKESMREEISLWVANLSNHITAERAMNALKRAKVKHPSEFRKVRVRVRVRVHSQNH
jgi:hypothetical protein